MKKILFRKLLNDYLSFFLIALLSSSIIIWVFQAVNFLDIMIEDGRDYAIYINYTLLNFPKIVSKVLPFVIFFSLFYVTLKYEQNNELVIFWTIGIHKIEIINFILKISFVLMLIQLTFTSLVVPSAQDLARSFLKSSTVNFVGNFIKPKRFNDTIKDITIYTERKDSKGNFYNIYIKKDVGEKEFQITYAKKGIFMVNDKNSVLELFDGQSINGKNNKITNFSFKKSQLPLTKLETNTTTYKKTQELSSYDLLKCLNIIYHSKDEVINTNIQNCLFKNLNNILKEFYKRFFIPLYIPILMLIPLILITTSKENLNFKKIQLITFMLGIFIIVFSETSLRLISDKLILNSIIILIPLVIILTIYIFFKNKFNISTKYENTY